MLAATGIPGSRLHLPLAPLEPRWLLTPASAPQSAASLQPTTACDPYAKSRPSSRNHARGELRTLTDIFEAFGFHRDDLSAVILHGNAMVHAHANRWLGREQPHGGAFAFQIVPCIITKMVVTHNPLLS